VGVLLGQPLLLAGGATLALNAPFVLAYGRLLPY
jgi:hypothetical protein